MEGSGMIKVIEILKQCPYNFLKLKVITPPHTGGGWEGVRYL